MPAETRAAILAHPSATHVVREALTALDVTTEGWPCGGHPHAVLATSYDDLLRITGGQSIETT